MWTELDDALRLASATMLRREQTREIVQQVQVLVESGRRAVEESRKLLALNDELLKALLLPRPVAPEPLTSSQLEELARLVANARGGYAFIWNAFGPVPVLDPAPSAAIQ